MPIKERDISSGANPPVGNAIKGAEVLWKGDPTEVAGEARINGRFATKADPPITTPIGIPGKPNDIP